MEGAGKEGYPGEFLVADLDSGVVSAAIQFRFDLQARATVGGRDAADNGLNFFEPLTPTSLVTPGFGGRFYFPRYNE